MVWFDAVYNPIIVYIVFGETERYGPKYPHITFTKEQSSARAVTWNQETKQA